MKINPYKYPFIAIEGIDGCGKSTLIEGLQKWDKENKIGSIFTKEPTDGNWGQMIRFILNNDGYANIRGEKVSAEDLQRLYIKDRLEHRQSEAVFLEMYSIFTDRDCPSTPSYYYVSHVNLGYLGFRWIFREHEEILGEYFFVPDLVIILDLPAEEAIKRIKKSGKEADYFEKLKFLKLVRDGYLAFPRWMQEIYPEVKTRVIIIDAMQSPEKVFEDSMFRIDRCFQEKLEETEYIKIFKK